MTPTTAAIVTPCLALCMLAGGCDGTASPSAAGGSSRDAAPSVRDAAGGAESAGAATTSPVTLRYEVGGMHCNGCSEAISAKVLEIAGVSGASVDHATGKAEFKASSESLDPRIRAAVERLGYTIKPAS